MFCRQYHSSSSSFHFSWTRNQPSPTARDALDVSASLFDLRLCRPSFPSSSSALLQVPRASRQALLPTSPGLPTFAAQRHKSVPLRYLQPTSRTLPSTPQESGSVPCWRMFIASLDPSVRFSLSLLA